MVRAAHLVVLGGCSGGGPPGEADCTRAKNSACDHQIACETAFDFTTCINAAEIESPVKNCTSNCKDDEYVAFCGGIGPGSVPERPASR